MAVANCPKMMSSLLFYHKKENPLTLAIENEGRGGLKLFCSERPGGAANDEQNSRIRKFVPRDLVERGESRGRGAEGGDANLPCPPFFLWGELFLLLLVRGEGKYEGAGAPHCAPGLTTHCALRTRAFPSVALSMYPLPQRDAYS